MSQSQHAVKSHRDGPEMPRQRSHRQRRLLAPLHRTGLLLRFGPNHAAVECTSRTRKVLFATCSQIIELCFVRVSRICRPANRFCFRPRQSAAWWTLMHKRIVFRRDSPAGQVFFQEACICPAGTYRPCHDFDDGGTLRPECQCDPRQCNL